MARSQIRNELVGVLGLLVVLLFAYKLIFIDLLFMPDGTMGHDYAYFLPVLLSGYFWYQTNGLAHIPWFTPSQCGGLPFLGDLQVPFYSAPQVLTFLQPPSDAVATTFLLFAAIGYLGAYGLLRFAFCTGPWMSAAGAAIFMFNGFYAYRVLIGHLTFHAFMLTPLLAWVLLSMPRTNRGNRSWVRICGHMAAGSLIVGYMLHAGMGNVFTLPFVAIATVMVLHALVFRWRLRPWVGGAFCGAGALAIAAIKLVPSLSFLSRFPRDFYTLPGFGNPFDTLQFAFSSLFFSVSANAASARLENQTWWTGQHEWEYGVTLVPLVLLAFGIVLRFRISRGFAVLNSGRILAIVALLLIGLLPLALNTYTEGWNEFLKGLPVIGQSASHFRLFAIYILPAIIAPAVLLDRAAKTLPQGALARISVVAIGTVLALNAAENKSYYTVGQTYDARGIGLAYLEARESDRVPAITHIAAKFDDEDRIVVSGPRNDFLTEGGSYAKCYQPIFGYRLETFPTKSMVPGPISDVRNGVFNLKNPSCYVFPTENDCVPGDHFTVDQRAAAENFAAYRPFGFRLPWYQTAATWTSILSVCAALAALMAWLVSAIRNSGDHD
jgi:hypothetical protein